MQVLHESVLWKYHQLKNGGYTVKVRITNFKNTEYISTEMSCLQENWDEKNCAPLKSHPQFSRLTEKIKEIKEDIDFELKLAKKNGETITLKQLKARVEKIPEQIIAPKTPAPQKKILEFYDIMIQEMEDAGNPGYSDLFKNSKSTITRWLLNGTDKHFTDITAEEFRQFEKNINTLKSESTKSNYLRTFYRLWNIAQDRKLCPKELHPKHFIQFKAYKRIRTRKRAVNFDYIKAIEALKFDPTSRIYRSQQYAIFSYYSRGINFNDLAKLQWDVNVKNGFLTYKRSKNKRDYHFGLHPKAIEIIEIFKNYPMQSEAGRVFPILDQVHDTPRKIATRVKSALKDFTKISWISKK